MFGPRFRSLFTSRWMALLWAVWICLMAVQFAGKKGQDEGAGSVDNETAAAIDQALGH